MNEVLTELADDIAEGGQIIHPGAFRYTMYPGTKEPFSICYAGGEKFVQQAVANPHISCIITTEKYATKIPASKGLIITDNPQLLYYRIHNKLVSERKVQLLEETCISKTATIHSSVEIRGNVVIEDGVTIEKDVIIEGNTIIKKNTYIGHRVIIGAKGMQNNRVQNNFINIAYGGGVEIGEGVEVLDYAIIQRPYNYLFTRIGDHTKISVKVNVGHGSSIGNYCMIAGNAQISGNVKIGDDVWVGPSVTVADGLSIGTKARVLIGSVVATHVPAGKEVSGNFAVEHARRLKHYSLLKKL
jgi:UDP-3-O-[3-hydroxymyristoyl] glucosamine N-acyltransferase